MTIQDKISNALQSRFQIPSHIDACARAIRYDLFNGPSWSRIPQGNIEQFTVDDFATYPDDLEAQEGDTIEETFVGKVADALRDFMLDLPSELYFDACSEEVLESEPEPWQDEESGEWIYPDDIYKLEAQEIRAALFGSFLAREFSL